MAGYAQIVWFYLYHFQLKSISRYNHTTDSCEGAEPGSPWQPALPDDTLFNSGEDDVLFFYGEPGKEEVSQSRYRASCLKWYFILSLFCTLILMKLVWGPFIKDIRKISGIFDPTPLFRPFLLLTPYPRGRPLSAWPPSWKRTLVFLNHICRAGQPSAEEVATELSNFFSTCMLKNIEFGMWILHKLAWV